jgi:hypothetical protein
VARSLLVSKRHIAQMSEKELRNFFEKKYLPGHWNQLGNMNVLFLFCVSLDLSLVFHLATFAHEGTNASAPWCVVGGVGRGGACVERVRGPV